MPTTNRGLDEHEADRKIVGCRRGRGNDDGDASTL